MSKNTNFNLCLTVIGILLTILVPVSSYYINKLNNLEKNFTILVTTLNLKSPNLHLGTFITLASKKNVSPENAATAIHLMENDSAEGKLYLENKLNFNTKEVNAIIVADHPPKETTNPSSKDKGSR